MSASNDSWPTRDVLRCAHLNINHANKKLTDTATPSNRRNIIVQELCESRGGRPELSVLTSLLASVDVKIY